MWLGRCFMGDALMGTHVAPLDHAERDLAAAELDDIVLTASDTGMDAWKRAVLEWHCAAVAKARTEAWIPGMALSQDRMVEKVLKRFYHHRVGVMLRALKTENLTLRRDLISARRHGHVDQRDGRDRRGDIERSIIEGLQSGVA
jgi:hypothetical protein